MHRTVIERIGVYHYETIFFPLPLGPFHVRQLPIAHSGKPHERAGPTAGPQKGFSGRTPASTFHPDARNDDFEREPRSGASWLQ